MVQYLLLLSHLYGKRGVKRVYKTRHGNAARHAIGVDLPSTDASRMSSM